MYLDAMKLNIQMDEFFFLPELVIRDVNLASYRVNQNKNHYFFLL